MSLVTVSAKKGGRIYPRKFDHDEALIRYAAGETVPALAKAYGVSYTAVERIVVPGRREAMDAHVKEHLMSGVCVDCGKPGISITRRHKGSPPRCRDCAQREQVTTVRPDTLFCCSCMRWLPDTAFPHSRRQVARRGRHRQCTPCQTAARTEYRNRHRVQCQGGCGRLVEGRGRVGSGNRGRRADRPFLCPHCWHQIQTGEIEIMAQTNGFIVLVETEEDVWRVAARFPNGTSKQQSLTDAFPKGPPDGRVQVLSEQVWRPGRATPVQVLELAVDD